MFACKSAATTALRRAAQRTATSSRATSSSNARYGWRALSSSSSSSTTGDRLMYDVIPKDDFGEYSEYSVIFTNRALNLMSDPFQRVMRDLNTLLKETYNAEKVAIIPG